MLLYAMLLFARSEAHRQCPFITQDHHLLSRFVRLSVQLSVCLSVRPCYYHACLTYVGPLPTARLAARCCCSVNSLVGWKRSQWQLFFEFSSQNIFFLFFFFGLFLFSRSFPPGEKGAETCVSVRKNSFLFLTELVVHECSEKCGEKHFYFTILRGSSVVPIPVSPPD